MSNLNKLSNTKHNHLTVSTYGEIDDWLEKEAVGNTAMAASYLANMRSFIEFAKDNEQNDLNSYAHTLTGVIARTSENRLADTAQKNGGILPVEIEGVAPLREVTEDDITSSIAQFDMMNPDYKGYNDSLEISRVNSYIMDVVNEEMSRAETEEA